MVDERLTEPVHPQMAFYFLQLRWAHQIQEQSDSCDFKIKDYQEGRVTTANSRNSRSKWTPAISIQSLQAEPTSPISKSKRDLAISKQKNKSRTELTHFVIDFGSRVTEPQSIFYSICKGLKLCPDRRPRSARWSGQRLDQTSEGGRAELSPYLKTSQGFDRF